MKLEHFLSKWGNKYLFYGRLGLSILGLAATVTACSLGGRGGGPGPVPFLTPTATVTATETVHLSLLRLSAGRRR